jgi:hypothetical protein
LFNYITVDFPGSETPPQRVYEFTFTQERFSHEMALIKFRDWDIRYSSIKSGSPVTFTLKTTGSSRVFYGYVQTISPAITPGRNLVEMAVIGASYKLKQANQRVFLNVRSSDVVSQIAQAQGFSYFVEDHPRVFEQVSQAGHTDLEIMTRLALQSGYSLRIENTSIYFRPLDYEFKNNRSSAPRFALRDANDPQGTEIYYFNATIGEGNQFDDSFKAAYRVSGVDADTGVGLQTKRETLPSYTRTLASPEFFDRFATNVVAPNTSAAFYESQAIDKVNQYPYRAMVSVIGSPQLRPDSPIYLDGLGPDYSGFWTVISATHVVVESQRNVFKYVTQLLLGTDSLSVANISGTSGEVPTLESLRLLNPGKLNIPIADSTVLSNLNPADSVTQSVAFSPLSNSKLKATSQGTKQAPIWKSTKKNLKSNTSRLTHRSMLAVDRLGRTGI